MDDALKTTLVALADVLGTAQDPWWVIGSAALALHGVPDITVRDIDVMLSLDDAIKLSCHLGLSSGPGAPDERFRSDLFATWSAQPLSVEFMAGFACREGAEWRAVALRSRQPFNIGPSRIYAPDRAELAALLRWFGRPKDLARVELLAAHRKV